jgi:hypothetical protein
MLPKLASKKRERRRKLPRGSMAVLPVEDDISGASSTMRATLGDWRRAHRKTGLLWLAEANSKRTPVTKKWVIA